MSDRVDQRFVDTQIRNAMTAARRAGATITLSRFVGSLRAANPGVEIHGTYVLDRLVRGARESNVVIEIDDAGS